MKKKIFILFLIMSLSIVSKSQITEPTIEIEEINSSDSLLTALFENPSTLLYLDICRNTSLDTLKKDFLFYYVKFKINSFGKVKKTIISKNMPLALKSIIIENFDYWNEVKTLKNNVKYKILPTNKYIIIPLISTYIANIPENELNIELSYLIPKSFKQLVLKPIVIK